jgi:hypothetical protein
MNQRIKQLVQQATTIEYGVDNGFDRVTFDKEKFAQLIAEDCAKMLDEDTYIIPELGGYAHDIRARYGVK